MQKINVEPNIDGEFVATIEGTPFRFTDANKIVAVNRAINFCSHELVGERLDLEEDLFD